MVMTKARIDNGEMEKKNVATTAGAADNCRSFLTFFTLLYKVMLHRELGEGEKLFLGQFAFKLTHTLWGDTTEVVADSSHSSNPKV